MKEHIESIRKRILDHQKENGFETVFDFIEEDLTAIESQNKELMELLKDYEPSRRTQKEQYTWEKRRREIIKQIEKC